MDEDQEKVIDKEDKKMQSLQVFMNLGLDLKKFQIDIKKLENRDKGSNRDAMQLFLLGNISRLADYYGNLNIQPKGIQEQLNTFRKPYCIHLLPQVFDFFQEFLVDYSRSFFDTKEDQEEVKGSMNSVYQMGSFLSILRIIKYNLVSLESFSDYFQKSGLKFPPENFLTTLKDIIQKILTRKSQEKEEEIDLEEGEINEIRQSIYNEALNILKYSLSFLYPDVA